MGKKDNIQKLEEILRQDQKVGKLRNRKELAELVGVSEMTIRRYLLELDKHLTGSKREIEKQRNLDKLRTILIEDKKARNTKK